jgi:hypothetical protein|tara:strand:+ start:23598 stop:23741 length:144 start_codon:yes stop_codon:yes gene_type:complete
MKKCNGQKNRKTRLDPKGAGRVGIIGPGIMGSRTANNPLRHNAITAK